MESMELGNRALAAIYLENHGNIYQRINNIRSKCLDALIWSGLGEDPRDLSEWEEGAGC